MLYGTLSKVGAGTADIHPLGYYTLLWMWMDVFGRSVLAARFFSVIINLISLTLVYLIALNLFNEKTAVTAAVLFSILPFQVHFAQEIRMYSLLSLWLLVATFSFLRGRTGNWKWWILFGISSALAQYTHNLAAIYLIPLALTPIIQKDIKTLKSVSLASIFAVILYLPWLIYLPAQFSKVNTSYWVERPGAERVFTLLLFYLPHLPLPNKLLLPGLMISLTTVALATYQTMLARKKSLPDLNRGVWLAYLAFMPSLLLWLISQFVPIYVERALLPSHAIFSIWLAWAFTNTPIPRSIQLFAFVLILSAAGMGIYQHVTYKDFPYGPYAEINESIQNRLQEGDVIIHANKNTRLPSAYFRPDISQEYIADPIGSNTDTLAFATQKTLNLIAQPSIESTASNAERVWLIVFQRHIDRYIELGYENHPYLIYLQQNFTLESVEQWDDLRVYLFTRQAKK